MKMPKQQRDETLRVLNCTLHGNHELQFLANDRQILCYRERQSSMWQPVAPQHLGIAAAVNRFGK